jgi:CRP-like cAMP-binding protein
MPAQPYDENAFLSELSASKFALLRPHLSAVELCVGDTLHNFGSPVDQVVFPHSGIVAMTMPVNGGAGASVILTGRDGVVGGFAASATAPATCNAEVCISGQAARMSASAFRHVLDQNQGIRSLAARFDNALMAQAQHTALCNATHAVEARICRWLLNVLDRSAGGSVPLTQAALAQMLGVRRTTVTLVAGRLEAAGALTCRRGYMQIISRGELERRSCDCYHLVRNYVAQLFARPVESGPAIAVSARERAERKPTDQQPAAS